jgi:tetratricopeptide (TPR) repeat protein
MTRVGKILLVLVACELLAGGIAVGMKVRAPQAPLIRESHIDAITFDDVRRLTANVRTSEDWRKLGEIYMATGFFRESEACHRVAAERDSESAETVHQWAQALERLGYLEEANAAYRRVSQLDPSRSAACAYFIGRNELRQEDVAAAREAFLNAGDFPAARFALARLHLGEGRHNEATALLDDLAREFPGAQQPPLLLHRIALAEQRLQAASAAADRQDAAREQLTSPIDAEFQRLQKVHEGTGLRRRWQESRELIDGGQGAAAEQLLRDILAERFDAFPADWLAEILFQRGQLDAAADIQLEIIERLGPAVEFLERLGDTQDALGEKDKARATWLRATQLSFGPPLRDVHGKLAASLAAAGQEQLATRHFALAAQAAGIGDLRAGNAASAEAALREAVRLDPQLAHAWYYLGEAARERGDAEAARAAYERCLAIQPHHGRAADRLERLATAEVPPPSE